MKRKIRIKKLPKAQNGLTGKALAAPNLMGDFELKKNLLKKNEKKNSIYIGCQILNKDLFDRYKIENFSITEIWQELLNKDMLNGFESLNKFYHLTNLNTFKKLKDF